MLEHCTTLEQCEPTLAKELRKNYLISDLPLTPQDVERLISLLQSHPKSTDLPQIAPNALACALVFSVHHCHEEADYWPSVSKNFAIEQDRLHKFFDDYLVRSPLAFSNKQSSGSRTSDIPLIFVHAGIPPRHLSEFMTKFVMPLVKEGNVTTLEAAHEVLVRLRQELARPQRVQRRIRSIEELEIKHNDLPATLEQLQEVESYLTLEAAAKAAGDFSKDFAHLDAIITVYQGQLEEIKTEMLKAGVDERESLSQDYDSVLSGYKSFLQGGIASDDTEVDAANSRIAAWQEARKAADLCFAHLLGSIPKFQKLIEFVHELQESEQAITEISRNGSKIAGATEIPQWTISESGEDVIEGGVLANIAHPIRRYLLHGDGSAESLLYKSALLLRHALAYGVIDRPSLERMSPYLAQPLLHWWAGQRTLSRRTLASEERFQSPWIQLNPQNTCPELILPTQRCKVAVGPLTLVLKDSVTGQELHHIQVHGRRRGGELIETEQLKFYLTPGLRVIQLALYDGDSKIKEWELPFQTANQPFQTFDTRNGRLCQSIHHLERLWLLLSKAATLQGEGYVIIANHDMDDEWVDFRLLELDLTSLRDLYLIDTNLVRYHLVDKGKTYCEIALGGSVSQIGKHIEDFPLYMGAMPTLELSYDDEQLIDSATLTIEVDTPQESVQWAMRDCLTFAQQQTIGKVHSLSINLAALLGGVRYGPVRLSITNLPIDDWYQVFCQVPSMNARFDVPIYLPWHTTQVPPAMLKLEIPAYAELVAHAPATGHKLQPGLWDIEVGLDEIELMGNLCWEADEHPFDIPLTFEIPKLLWLLSGDLRTEEGWFQESQREELWLGDWEKLTEQELWIKVPSYVQGNIRLTSPDLPARREERPIVEQIAKFDLAAWRAQLSKGKAVKSLQVSHLPPQNIAGRPYFHQARICSVRSLWEAQDIGCVQTAQANRMKLNIGWVERGEAEERKLYLWRQTGELILEQLLEPGTSSFEISLDDRALLPGNYRIQLVAIDPWDDAEPQYPEAHALSTLLIKILAAQELHQDEVIEIRTAIYEGKPLSLAVPYQIRITGRIIGQSLTNDLKLNGVVVKKSNQNWYWGELLESGHPELDAEIRISNPIKFPESLINSEIGAIEARDGEGAMYCRRCKQLHWRHENMMDTQHASQLRGPINRFHRKQVRQALTIALNEP